MLKIKSKMKSLFLINFLFVAVFLCSCSTLKFQRSEHDVMTPSGLLRCVYERGSYFNCHIEKELEQWQDMENEKATEDEKVVLLMVK